MFGSRLHEALDCDGPAPYFALSQVPAAPVVAWGSGISD